MQKKTNSRKFLADWLLIAAAAAGLIAPLGLTLLVPALLARGGFGLVKWRLANILLLMATAWACLVIAIRGTAGSAGTLPYYAFLWILPHILTVYRPDRITLQKFEAFLIMLFMVDLFFNLFALISGADILGRVQDVRDGVVGGRLGGIFAHSFYSGAISLAALLTILTRERFVLLAIFPTINMLMAGSWRFAIALIIIIFFAIGWRKRSRFMEIVYIFIFSLFIVLGVMLTSDFFNLISEPNRANTFRFFAWFNSIEKILNFPWFGVGYQNVNGVVDAGVTFESMDENLIGESWYLDTAITFGIPYTVLFLGALLAEFFGKNYYRRNLVQAVLYPYILIDLVYGGFFGSVLIYFWLWLLISVTTIESKR